MKEASISQNLDSFVDKSPPVGPRPDEALVSGPTIEKISTNTLLPVVQVFINIFICNLLGFIHYMDQHNPGSFNDSFIGASTTTISDSAHVSNENNSSSRQKRECAVPVGCFSTRQHPRIQEDCLIESKRSSGEKSQKQFKEQCDEIKNIKEGITKGLERFLRLIYPQLVQILFLKFKYNLIQIRVILTKKLLTIL